MSFGALRHCVDHDFFNINKIKGTWGKTYSQFDQLL